MKIKDKKELVKLASFITMGDGGVYKSSDKSEAYFVMNMIQKNEDYVDYCRDVISNITTVSKRKVIKDITRQDQFRIESRRHPFFTKLHNRIYNNKYKGMDWHVVKMLDYECLSILYMSDGSLFKDFRPSIGMINPSYRVTLNLKRLSYGDTLLLKKYIKTNLGLEFNVNKQKNKKGGYYYYLALRTKDVESFMKGVRPFVLESFKYKVLDEKLFEKEDDEIV